VGKTGRPLLDAIIGDGLVDRDSLASKLLDGGRRTARHHVADAVTENLRGVVDARLRDLRKR
jgi:hypothetical protein